MSAAALRSRAGFRLSGNRYLRAALSDRELERRAGDALTPQPRDELETLRNVGSLHVLDAGVKVFNILTNDDEVDAAP